jgi:hypothetical protein
MRKQLHDAIATLLVTDASFVAAVRALGFGATGAAATPQVVRGMRDWRKIPQERLPCWVLEPGDSQTTDQGIGSCHYVQEAEALLALVWHQQDHDTAYNQRLALEDDLSRLFLRNPRPGNVADTVLDASGNDRQANHPFHIVTFRLLSILEIRRNA